MTKVLQIVEIDVPQCALTYSVSPCQASLVSSPPTGTIKCFNSLGTCQDRVNFTDVPVTYRYMEDVQFRDESVTTSTPGGAAVSFNGSTDDFQIALNLGVPITVTAWFKTTATDGVIAFTSNTVGNPPGGSSYENLLYVNNVGKLEGGWYDGSVKTVASLAAVNNGAWRFGAITIQNSSVIELFVDGSSQGTTAFGTGESGGNAQKWIGVGNTGSWPNSAGSTRFFNGKLSDVRFYNRVLSGSEITTLYNGGEVTSGLQGEYIKTNIATAADESGNGNNGSVNGTPTATGDGPFPSTATLSIFGTDPTMRYDALALIKTIDYQPAIVSFDGTIGQRAQIKVTFKDAPFPDNTDDYDKYRTERTYTPWNQGSYWGKFRARNPFLRGRALRYYQGEAGNAIASFEERLFLIESIDGPNANGEFQIIAKDTLKLAAADRAQAPFPSEAFLSADLTVTTAPVAVTLSGSISSFGLTGKATIAGSEVVTYEQGDGTGNDSNTKLLMHFTGVNAGTASSGRTDSSGGAHGDATVPAGSPTTSTVQFKFGGSSLFFDADEYIQYADHADWQLGGGTGNFTIDCWIYVTGSPPSNAGISQQFADANNLWQFYMDSSRFLHFRIISAGATIINMTQGSGAMATSTWNHVAVVRNSSSWNVYLNGTSVASQSASVTVPNLAATLDIAAIAGPFYLQDAGGNAWMDEYRISNVARWTTTFTPPTAMYGSDVVVMARGQNNTVAATHTAQDKFQPALSYTTQDPVDIIADLLETYAFVDSSYIPITDWQTESNAYSSAAFTLVITEPTGVDELIAEILEQVGAALWWDDIGHQIRFQIIRAIDTDADRYNEDNVLADTMEVREQPQKRISQVYVYFAQIDPTKKRDETNNYRSFALVTDTQSEEDEGSAMIKKIFARGIPTGGRSIAESMAENWLSRFTVAPRRFNFEVLRYAGNNPTLGLGVQLGGGDPSVISWPFQDETGDNVSIPTQITSIGAKSDRWLVEAEEMLSTIVGGGGSPDHHTVIIDANQYNINLRTIHDALYGTPVSGTTIDAIVNSGVLVGSTSTGSPAFDIGTWPGGVTVILTVSGRIEGHGGGGGGFELGGNGNDGAAGGTALYTRQAISLILNVGSAEIWSGGGGGAGSTSLGGGGGGGYDPGDGGETVSGGGQPNGQPGTTEAGGAGVSAGGQSSGNGGAPGVAGSGSSTGASGGAAGSGIDGVSFCTKTGTGDIRGGQVN
jgi:Concanavalin A-like lectin/glucanases superfamily